MSVKKIAFFTAIILSLFIINGLVHSIYNLWQKQHLIDEARMELEKEKKENKSLKQKLSVVKKPQFVEQEARNRLFLTKPGEGLVVLPTDNLPASHSSKPNPQDMRPNWQRWWELFFSN